MLIATVEFVEHGEVKEIISKLLKEDDYYYIYNSEGEEDKFDNNNREVLNSFVFNLDYYINISPIEFWDYIQLVLKIYDKNGNIKKQKIIQENYDKLEELEEELK